MKKLFFINVSVVVLFYNNMIQPFSYQGPMPFFNAAQCEESDEKTEFFFDDSDSARKKPLYTQKEEIDNLIGRFCRILRQRDSLNTPQSVFIDIAREIVNSDDECKAEQNYMRYMLFKYPLLGYAGVAVLFFGTGYLAHYAFS
ncbi:hypothetical protein K9K77_02440 [Candidatus Babeliales bacterium]|nr:hypothetical protein [Candidatus Babeliales bacterium]